jgi:phosphinothricin acetyltransferase
MSTMVRKAVEADVAAIVDIYNEAIQETTATFDTELKSIDDQLEWFQSHDDRHPALVLEHVGTVVGWVSLSAWSDRRAYSGTAEITYYVLQNSRGLGFGRKLQDSIISVAKRQGFHTLIARITAGNDISIRLCETSGFKHIGTMKEVGRKFGELLDVHILQKMLG